MAGPTAQFTESRMAPSTDEPREGGRRGAGGATRSRSTPPSERVPAVGGEVGEVTGADQAVAAEQRVDRDRREDHRERRQRSRRGRTAMSGERQRSRRTRSRSAAGRRGGSATTARAEQHREEQRLAQSDGRGQQQVGRDERHDEQGVQQAARAACAGRQAGRDPSPFTALSHISWRVGTRAKSLEPGVPTDSTVKPLMYPSGSGPADEPTGGSHPGDGIRFNPIS